MNCACWLSEICFRNIWQQIFHHELMLVDETFILAKQLRWPAETCQGHGRMGTGAEAHKTAGRRGVHCYSDVITGGGWKRSIRSFTLNLSDLSVCFLSCAGSEANTLKISKNKLREKSIAELVWWILQVFFLYRFHTPRFQDVVHAVMKFCSSDLCLLCGKGPGAKRAVEVAAKAWNEPGEG